MTHDKLRELAQAATPGPWFDFNGEIQADTRRQECCGQPCQHPGDGSPYCCGQPVVSGAEDDRIGMAVLSADAEFIQGANPSTVLRLLDEIAALKAELETERMRLAACGVVAMSNTPESAKRNREMLPEYRSASCGDVMRAVDREMALRDERDALKAENERLKVSHDEWIAKTEWVQQTAQPKELGMHRADIMTQRIRALSGVLKERGK